MNKEKKNTKNMDKNLKYEHADDKIITDKHQWMTECLKEKKLDTTEIKNKKRKL